MDCTVKKCCDVSECCGFARLVVIALCHCFKRVSWGERGDVLVAENKVQQIEE